MKKKQKKLQIFLLSAGLILFFTTYLYYPSIYNNKYSKEVTIEERKDDIIDIKVGNSNNESTAFKNIEYKGLYYVDKPFKVNSENAYILNDDPDVVHMDAMHVVLYLSDQRVINITSDKGMFNKVTNDCFLKQNVKATDGDIIILSENLDLVASEKFAEIYNNVNLDYVTGKLQADKINYDFMTKLFKVSMFDDKTVKLKVFQ